MTTTAHAWVPIQKSVRQEDGTLLVTGVASDSSLDRDLQIADPAWLNTAMPMWFREGGNIREQHDKHKAAGVATEYQVTDQGQHVITAHIVDPVTVTKVENKVLRGFSFGARNARVTVDKAAAGGRIVDGQIYEVSVVDRPANPAAVLTIAKADSAGDLQLVEKPELVEKTVEVGGKRVTPADLALMLDKRAKGTASTSDDALSSTESTEKADADTDTPAMFGEALEKAVSADQRKQDAKSGVAMPNGDFPIPDEGHLKSAVGLLGNYKGDKAAARKHIVKRARALKLTNLLPEDWGITKADEIVAEFGLLAQLDKADGAPDAATEVGDIAGAKQAIAAIARLIVSEANDLASGELGEICDIQTLIEAARSLKWFICSEAEEVGNRTEPAATEVTVTIDSGEIAATDSPATGAGVIEKTDNSTTDQIATLTKALTDQGAALEALRSELAEVKTTPIPGGPVRTRTADQTAAASQRSALTTDLRKYDQLAKTTDGDLASGYRKLADNVRAELAKIDG